MRLIIKRGSIREAVSGFTKVIPNKSSIPILGGIRVAVTNNNAIAQATDLDQVLEYEFADAEFVSSGRCIIPFSVLKNLAKGAGGETVEINTESPDRITIVNHVGGHAVSQMINGMEPDEWPELETEFVSSPTDMFIHNYRKLVAFSSTDETRYILNSVFAEIGEGSKATSMVATDGRRLACFNHMELPFKCSVIIPKSKFLSWTKLPSNVDVGLRDDNGTTWLGVKAGAFTYTAKCPEGTYPNFRQVIPAKPGSNIITFSEEDAELLKQVLQTFPGGNEVTLIGQGDKVKLYGRDRDDARWSTLTLENTDYEGERKFVGLDRGYVLDALAAGFRKFAFRDELSPLLSDDGKGGLHVLMPIRVTDPEEGAVTYQAEKPASTEQVIKSENPVKTTKPKGNNTVMSNENKNEVPALSRVLTACDTAKAKVKEVGSALSELTAALRVASREQKSQSKEIESARATLARLQSISL